LTITNEAVIKLRHGYEVAPEATRASLMPSTAPNQ
jgi:hypothetical protein